MSDGMMLAQAEHVAEPPSAKANLEGAQGEVAPVGGDEHAAAGKAHEAAHDKYLMPHEMPNFATWIEAAVNPEYTSAHGHRSHPATGIRVGDAPWAVIPINPLFSIFYAIVLVLVIRKGLGRATVRRPGKSQNFVELVLGGLYNFFYGVLGESGKQYIPFAGSLFLFIFVNNIMGLVPGFKSPTSSMFTTVALGFLTFCYVHFNVIKQAGVKAWFMHLVGEPLWMFPLMFPLHVLGELIKPVSLAARLFGNILGEDKLLAAFLGIGMLITSALLHDSTPIVGIPLQLPFYFLVVLGSTIQATVFSLLASIYIVLLLPHDDHHGHEDHAHAHAAPH